MTVAQGYSQEFRQILLVILGSSLSALGYASFQVPFGIAAGGVTGLAILVEDVIPLSVGATIWLLNIPMLYLGFRHLGRWRFLMRTVIAVTVFSLCSDLVLRWLPLFADQWPLTDNVLLAAIYGGVVGGVGLGMVFRGGSSLGGTGVIGRILQARLGVPLSTIYLYTDGGIVALAGVLQGWESALFALLTLFLHGVASDYVLEGPSTVRTAMIVTDHPQTVTTSLIHQLGRGAAFWDIEGGYSGHGRALVMCTVHRPQVHQLKQVVNAIDPDAFLTIGVSHQAYGVGFSARS